MYSFAKIKTLAATGLIIFTAHFQAFSQTYQVNGTAVNNGNGLVRLTTSQASAAQTASAWSTTKIDLTQPFDMTFEMFFGCNNDPATGGDGMTFTLHNDPRGLNATGAGFGFLGIGGAPAEMVNPALSIEFDTYDASGSGGSNELAADHIAIDLNGDVNVGQSFIGSGGTPVTVQAVANNRDLEDCSENGGSFYKIRITWDPVNKVLQLFEEGSTTPSLTYTNDLITNLFGNVNEVYWGFTGATGTASNEQWIAPEGSIIPWECTISTSCCTAFTVTPNSPTTICNNPITLSVAGTYDSYSWSNGTTDPTTQISAPGTYTLNVLQTQGTNSCPGSATFTITPTGPTATLTGGGTFCNSSQTTPLSVALTGTAPWSLVYAIDGVNQPAVTGITTSPYVFQGNAPHVYTLVSVGDNSGCNSTATGTANVDLLPGIPVGYDTIFTAPNTANLYVKDDGGTYNWYDAPTGGNLVQAGDTAFTTPVLNETTTYYVENTAVTGYERKSVSLLNKSEGTGNDPNDHVPGLPPAVCYLEFTANSDFILDTITCLVNVPAATTNGRVTVYITPYTGTAPYGGAETVAKDSMNITIGTTGQHN
ncbi:MAG: legume lectin beta domain protein, partial [Cytophagaceae bacterium]|nr:legume lectin beta domain protein [Cytophagaceae bacterium]